ncbi:hypothetical protein HD596_008471 [Nonomuraea jabiensis]|uniref:Uncharacterized protein n=1 Tax=Nonomuraea jabiensis TaxID=882448 RepID=A0A7W9GDC5_9ACTN|nr:hypothetical protein [Nonomuraea jabiensis]
MRSQLPLRLGTGWRWGHIEYIVPAAKHDRLVWLAAIVPPLSDDPPALAVTEQVPVDLLNPLPPRTVVVANETTFP